MDRLKASNLSPSWADALICLRSSSLVGTSARIVRGRYIYGVGAVKASSRLEWVSVQDMEKAVEVIVNLAAIWEERS
jgi:hypothetical protein